MSDLPASNKAAEILPLASALIAHLRNQRQSCFCTANFHATF